MVIVLLQVAIVLVCKLVSMMLPVLHIWCGSIYYCGEVLMWHSLQTLAGKILIVTESHLSSERDTGMKDYLTLEDSFLDTGHLI